MSNNENIYDNPDGSGCKNTDVFNSYSDLFKEGTHKINCTNPLNNYNLPKIFALNSQIIC